MILLADWLLLLLERYHHFLVVAVPPLERHSLQSHVPLRTDLLVGMVVVVVLLLLRLAEDQKRIARYSPPPPPPPPPVSPPLANRAIRHLLSCGCCLFRTTFGLLCSLWCTELMLRRLSWLLEGTSGCDGGTCVHSYWKILDPFPLMQTPPKKLKIQLDSFQTRQLKMIVCISQLTEQTVLQHNNQRTVCE